MLKNFKDKPLYEQVGIITIELVLLYLIVVNLDRIFGGIGSFLGTISPFIMGAAIAYLLNKPASEIQRILEGSRRAWVVKKAHALSVILVFVLLIAVISLIITFVTPIVVNNVQDFAGNVMNYYDALVQWVEELDSNHFLYRLLPNMGDGLLDFITPDVVNQIGTGATQVAGHIMSATSWIVNFFLAMIAALYMLLTKDNIMALIRRLLHLFMKKSTYGHIASYAAKCNDIFYKYVGAQFLVACFVGAISTIVLAILRVPYAVTFGFLLGIFNMIPIFGSLFAMVIAVGVTIFTGGVPLAILTFVALLGLQQLEASFIGPKITGDALRLQPLLIIFAIVVGGAYFNIIGMFIAAPTAAILKMFLEDFMDAREKKLNQKKVESHDDT